MRESKSLGAVVSDIGHCRARILHKTARHYAAASRRWASKALKSSVLRPMDICLCCVRNSTTINRSTAGRDQFSRKSLPIGATITDENSHSHLCHSSLIVHDDALTATCTGSLLLPYRDKNRTQSNKRRSAVLKCISINLLPSEWSSCFCLCYCCSCLVDLFDTEGKYVNKSILVVKRCLIPRSFYGMKKMKEVKLCRILR